MQYKVPQFIGREARIIGPLTLRQFLFLGGGGVIIFILYSSLAQIHAAVFILLTIIIAAISLSLAFLKVDGHSFVNVILGFSGFTTSPRVYLWERKKTVPKISMKSREVPAEDKIPLKDHAEEMKLLKKSRLKNLSSQIEIK